MNSLFPTGRKKTIFRILACMVLVNSRYCFLTLSRKTWSWCGMWPPSPSDRRDPASSSCSRTVRGANWERRSATQPGGADASPTESDRGKGVNSRRFSREGKEGRRHSNCQVFLGSLRCKDIMRRGTEELGLHFFEKAEHCL